MTVLWEQNDSLHHHLDWLDRASPVHFLFYFFVRTCSKASEICAYGFAERLAVDNRS